MVKQVIKRNGDKVLFDSHKIIQAISKAGSVPDLVKNKIAQEISSIADKEVLSVEEIQDLVENKLMASSYKHIAREYVRYRYIRELLRGHDKLHRNILEIVEHKNDYVNSENSNKNPQLLSTQRDYMAGEVSKDVSLKILLPQEIVDAHLSGIIHFHDLDYFAQTMHNCCLVNLEDMLQNGTVISKTFIEKPHSFHTACNIATQIVAQVASNQYGGQSITLSHLAPFVDISRQKIHKEVESELQDIKFDSDEDRQRKISEITESRVRSEVKRGVQTIQYQVNTLMTCNGQTPFITVFMYINEVPDGQTRKDLALIIEEVLKQRIQGVKNETGAWITPAFPKLVYALTENNMSPDSEYWYLTELAAKCTAKRLVPDYLSEKIMLNLKIDENGNGNVYPPMGCLDFQERIELEFGYIEIGKLARALELISENQTKIFRFMDSADHKYSMMINFGDEKTYLSISNKDTRSTCSIKYHGSQHEDLLTDDLKGFMKKTVTFTLPNSICYNLPEGYLKIKCRDQFVGLKTVMVNKEISDWYEVTYAYKFTQYDKLSGNHWTSYIRTAVKLTSDHPLPLKDGSIIKVADLKKGDQLICVHPSSTHEDFPEVAEVIEIIKLDRTCNSYDVSTETEYFNINGDLLSHNCRSFLTPGIDENGKPHYYGRFNQGVVTINLPDVALSALKSSKENGMDKFEEFWKIFEDRLELCHRGLQYRHNRLKGTPSDVSPIHWQYGALARLKKGELIDKLLYNNYSTISLGYQKVA